MTQQRYGVHGTHGGDVETAGQMIVALPEVELTVDPLASKDGSYVTGTTLMVDGGFNYLR